MSKHSQSEVDFIFETFREQLEKEARRQADSEAFNYRNYHVGCAILATNRHELKIFGGANMMPRKGGQKSCAEIQSLNKAYIDLYDYPLVICVAAVPQRDDTSGKTPLTLPPCGNCRSLFQYLYKLPPQTLIYMITLEENGPTELRTLQEILELYPNRN